MNIFILFLIAPVLALNNIYGDSILSSTTPIEKDLSKLYNTSFNNYATIGSGMQSGWVDSIPQQYLQHKSVIPTNVIMDGGGNDVFSIRLDCMMFNDICRSNIDHICTLAGDLINYMKKDGVKNIIYVGFYYNSDLNKAIDYGSNKLSKICLIKNQCYFVDLRNISVPTSWDGIHPTEEGYHLISKSIQNSIKNHHIHF